MKMVVWVVNEVGCWSSCNSGMMMVTIECHVRQCIAMGIVVVCTAGMLVAVHGAVWCWLLSDSAGGVSMYSW